MTGTVLDKLVAASRARLERDMAEVWPDELKRRVEAMPEAEPFRFEKALAAPGMGFICEVKRASPSKGMIAQDFPYVEIAKEYEAAGAAGISVLTETEYFLGSDRYLNEISKAVGTPLLRKDFLFDEYQIWQAKAMGASAVLLICAILEPGQLAELIGVANALGLSALVEAHDEAELEMALQAGARLIGVNNRDLRDFTVDTGLSVRLRGLAPKEVLFVSESGIATGEDVDKLCEAGVDAVLVGETLMRAPDKRAALAALRGEG